ncbi:hypothetical protein AB0N31_10560 [Streptomyces sp. NPDC051051]|uniref:hypothetical protein n=1 Tax=Streptomyces sp. NPDC051051 TaxID=3155666 RepID=UPI00341297DC
MSTPIPRPAPTTGYGTCDDCGARVLWCLTEANRRRIPIDPPEDPTGNQAVRVDADGTYWARQLSRSRPHVELREVLRRPHIASCRIARARAAARRRTPHRATHGVRPVRWQR